MTSEAKEEGINYSYNHQSGHHDEASTNVAIITDTGLADARSRTRTSHVLRYKALFGISVTCLATGMFCGNMGRWTRSDLGFTGMFLVGLGIVSMVSLSVKRLYHGSNIMAAGGHVNRNQTVPTVTLHGGITTPSQAGGTTSHVIGTNGMQSGGVAMETQGYNTQSAPLYAHPVQNYPGIPYQPPLNGTLQFAPSNTNPPAVPMPYPQPGTPPMSYPVMHHPPPPDGQKGVAQPGSGVGELPPPPTYEDLFAPN